MKVAGAVVLSLMLVLALSLMLREDARQLEPQGTTIGGQGRNDTKFVLEPLADAEADAEEESHREAATVETVAASLEDPDDMVPPLATLRGRFLLSDGSPASGVSIKVSGWSANQERVMRYGKPKNWSDLQFVTKDDGTFEIEFDPPRAYQFVLDGKLAGYAEASWRWSQLPPGEVTDVGVVMLIGTGSIAGRLVDKDGDPVPGVWTIYAETSYRQSGAGGEITQVQASVDGNGEFSLSDLPPGPVRLEACSRLASWIDGPTVEVRIGETTRAEFVYDVPDNRRRIDYRRRIVVTTFSRPFHSHNNPEPGSIVLHTAAGTIAAEKIGGSSQSWSFDDVLPGSYLIEITDPKYLPWSREGIEPGETVSARLKGSSAVSLAVHDENTGERVTEYALKVRFRNVNFSPNIFQIRELSGTEPENGVYDGLMPGDISLVVEAPGFATLEIPIDNLQPNETRTVTGEVSLGSAVRGVVRRAGSGDPVPGVTVRLTPHLEGKDPSDPFAFSGDMSARSALKAQTREQSTDQEGRFVFEAVARGQYDAVAAVNPIIRAIEKGIEVEGASVEIVLTLPGTGYLSGRIIGPPDAEYGGISVSAVPTLDKERVRWIRNAIPSSTLDEDGRYRLGPLPAGSATVSVVLAATMVHGFSGSARLERPRMDIGEAYVPSGSDAEMDIDMRDRFPGTLRVVARVDGELSPGLQIRATCETDTATWQVNGQAGPDGTALLGVVFPGNWSLRVSTYDRAWSYEVPEQVVIEPGAAVQAVVDVLLYAGSLSIVDAESNEPLIEHSLFLMGNGLLRQCQTDDGGRLWLTLPQGTYEIRGTMERNGRRLPSFEEGSEVEWTPAGPAPPVVSIKTVD